MKMGHGMKNFFCLVVAVTLLTACDPRNYSENDSVDGHGNCTQSYIDARNGAQRAIRLFSLEATQDQADLADQACDFFYLKHDNITCKAVDPTTGEEKKVTSDDLRDNCKAVKNAKIWLLVKSAADADDNANTKKKTSN